jgi:hypothetical protein
MSLSTAPLPATAAGPEVVLEETEDIEISWYSLTTGGTTSANQDEIQLISAIGQVIAGRASGGGFLIDTGFAAGAQQIRIFSDGFETGDTSRWSVQPKD